MSRSLAEGLRAWVLAGAVTSLLGCASSSTPAPAPVPAPAASRTDEPDALALARQKNREPLAEPPSSEPTDAPRAADGEPPPVVARAYRPRDADVAQALVDANDGKLERVRARLFEARARITREAELEDRMLAHALLGRAHERAKDRKGAEREFERAIALWAEPTRAVERITGGAQPTQETAPRLAQALEAVGEALFFRAEQKRRVADGLAPVALRGARTQEAVSRYMKSQVVPWFERRRAAIGQTEEAYRAILELRPLPPPRWVVAAAAQRGVMLEAFAAALERLPVPNEIRQNPELLSMYRQALDDVLAPQRAAAQAAYRACAELAQKFAIESEYGRRCSEKVTAPARPR